MVGSIFIFVCQNFFLILICLFISVLLNFHIFVYFQFLSHNCILVSYHCGQKHTSALFRCYWCLYKKKLVHKNKDIGVETQKEVKRKSKRQPKERGFRRNQTCRHLALRCLLPWMVWKHISVVYLFFNLIFILYWSMLDLQCGVSFRYIAK